MRKPFPTPSYQRLAWPGLGAVPGRAPKLFSVPVLLGSCPSWCSLNMLPSVLLLRLLWLPFFGIRNPPRITYCAGRPFAPAVPPWPWYPPKPLCPLPLLRRPPPLLKLPPVATSARDPLLLLLLFMKSSPPPLPLVLWRPKAGLPVVPGRPRSGDQLLFARSPNAKVCVNGIWGGKKCEKRSHKSTSKQSGRCKRASWKIMISRFEDH